MRAQALPTPMAPKPGIPATPTAWSWLAMLDKPRGLTEVLNDAVYGWLKKGIHGVWTHPQHTLGGPLHKIHTVGRWHRWEQSVNAFRCQG